MQAEIKKKNLQMKIKLNLFFAANASFLYLINVIQNIQLHRLCSMKNGRAKRNIETLYFPNVEAKIHTCPAACVTGNGYFSVEISS